MAKKSFYAVRKGKETGIFESWDACKNVVNGYGGAEYKGFATLEEAESWLKGNEIIQPQPNIIIPKIKDEKTVNIYTDGSFKDDNISIGIYIESLNKKFSFYGCVDCDDFAVSRNVTGELLAVLSGVELAKDLGFSILNIIYDYQGIGSWYSGAWKYNGELQERYVILLNSFREQYELTYNFIKVKGHSNIMGNKYADTLARRGVSSIYRVHINRILNGNLTVLDVGQS